MKLRLTAFGIAKDILKASTITVADINVRSVGDLKKYLMETYPEFKELLKFSLAVGDEYQDDDFALSDNDEVIIIPPVSGG